MKYLFSLVLIILIGCFLFPVASSTVCERNIRQYNVLDILTGKPTDDLFDCINKVMVNDINSTTSSSPFTSSGYTTYNSSEWYLIFM